MALDQRATGHPWIRGQLIDPWTLGLERPLDQRATGDPWIRGQLDTLGSEGN